MALPQAPTPLPPRGEGGTHRRRRWEGEGVNRVNKTNQPASAATRMETILSGLDGGSPRVAADAG